MSYWPQMFKGAQKKFLLCTNNYDEICLFKLDNDGAPESFCSGHFEDVLVSAFIESHPNQAVAFDCSVSEGDFRVSSWQELCDKLNSKKRSVAKTIWNNVFCLRNAVDGKIIEFDDDENLWKKKGGDAISD